MSSPGYPSYPQLKESVSDWVGRIPRHWSEKKLKFTASAFASNVDKKTKPGELEIRLCNYTDVYYNEVLNADLSFMKATATKEQIAKFALLAGDTIITKDSEGPDDIAIPALVEEEMPGVICGYHLSIIRPTALTDPRYLNRVFQCPFARSYFATKANGLTRYGLGAAALGRLILPKPPLKEQTQIAKFLDYETAKIDALIEKQQQLIALLEEKRQAVISHAVTKGLDPDVPMRDSGVEWLGEVPAHWKIGQLRRWIRKIEQGKSPECESRPAETAEWGVLKTGCVNGGIYREQENKALPANLSPMSEYEVREGDILMSRASGSPDLIGSVAFVHSTRSKILLSDKIFRIHFGDGVHGEYFTSLMRSLYMRSSIVRSISGAEGMANNITKSSVLEFSVALPPISEQESIATEINSVSSRLTDLTTKAALLLETLAEKRTALISAAVTGKIDVRGWTPPETSTQAETP